MCRLKQLRKEFDRITGSCMELGYTADMKRRLAQLAKDIKQEEAALRFIGDDAKENKSEKSIPPVV